MDSGKAVKRLFRNTYFSLEYRDDGVFFQFLHPRTDSRRMTN